MTDLIYLQPTVDIKTVLSQLMDRLSNYAASSTEVSCMHLLSKIKLPRVVDIISASGIARISASGSIYQIKHSNWQGKPDFLQFGTFTHTYFRRTTEKDVLIKLWTMNRLNVMMLSKGCYPFMINIFPLII